MRVGKDHAVAGLRVPSSEADAVGAVLVLGLFELGLERGEAPGAGLRDRAIGIHRSRPRILGGAGRRRGLVEAGDELLRRGRGDDLLSPQEHVGQRDRRHPRLALARRVAELPGLEVVVVAIDPSAAPAMPAASITRLPIMVIDRWHFKRLMLAFLSWAVGAPLVILCAGRTPRGPFQATARSQFRRPT